MAFLRGALVHRTAAGLLALPLLAGAGFMGAVAVSHGAAAAGPVATCGNTGVLTTSVDTETCTYSAAGTEDTFSVPAGVGTVSVSAIGGAGGIGGPNGGTGGEGAVVTNSALPVGPGATLFVDVGGDGSAGTFDTSCNFPVPGAAGGTFDGGSGGGSPSFCDLHGGGGGGGSSAVSTEARADATLSGNPATDSRLLVAGGGGGAGGQSGNGGGAGDAAVTGAGNGGDSPVCGPTANGSPGGVGGPGGTAPSGCSSTGGSGSASAGGAGGAGDACDSGGGGGGGWFGGAGASIDCTGAGGGGGSSYAGAGAGTTSVTTADSTQAPEVAISWVTVVNGGAPSISGTPTDGQILTADPGTWSSPDTVSYSYQWVTCADATTANCTTDIPNATNSTYTLAASDVGTYVGVVVTATDNESQSASATANPVGLVATAGICGTSGTSSTAGDTDTCTYSAAGTEDTFSVPAGVGTVSVSAIGGSGGAGVPFEGSEGGTGGEGAVVTNGALPVGPGAILFVDVGGGGSPGTFSSNCNGVPNPGAAGGDFDGGGGGGGPNDCVLLSGGGGGGGSSAVSSEARADATLSGNPATDSRLLVAGAGAGGGGQSGNGGNAGDAAVTGAGNSGGSPACDPTPNGSSGGVGGPGGTAPTGCLRPGGSGSASAGGAGGGGGCASGGGGGGGWFGGAGASITCAGAGGGGGSSYAGAGSGTTSVTTADSTQAPEVAISWVAVVNNGAPSISGTPADGQILTADPGTWNSPDTVSYSYQWVSCADATTANCTSDIPNATNLTYTLQASDVGTFVGVVVTATDNESQSASATASPVGAVGDPPPPQNDTLPVISGSAVQDGVVVSKIPGTWSSPDTLTYGREWERCPTAAAGPGSGCVGIKPENSGLALTAADVGFYITIMVTATDQEQQSTTIYATPFGPVTAPAPPSNTEAPVISGTASVGSVLHVSTGTWSSPDHLAYTYQWGYLASPGGTFTALTGATRNHYRLGTTNLGEEITVQVTTTDKEGQSSTVPAAQPVGPVERRS